MGTGVHMNLRQINDLWDEYKKKYGLDMDIRISAVVYDAEKYVEGFFNLLELLDGKYILHLNPRFHLYSDSYARFILFHEFTHFYDFINCPFDKSEDLFIYMNAYSEFHACRVTLARFMERLTIKTVHVNKIQIPGPFNEISIRNLLEEGLWRVKVSFEQFMNSLEPNDFIMTFRQLMYLLGYISLFENDEVLLKQTLEFAHLDTDDFVDLYHALKDIEIDEIIRLTRKIYDVAFLIYLRGIFRKKYDKDILPDDELEQITTDNYEEYKNILDKRAAKRAA
ncbi:MAG: hypothetical protein MR867_05275 [Eubacterium sp.]|nr:hypothetical protein [Eubacterium sp.]